MNICFILNTETVKDAHPLAWVEEALEGAHGFLQCTVEEEDVTKTAFQAGSSGLFEYIKMLMGLCNAPATFSRLMQVYPEIEIVCP